MLRWQIAIQKYRGNMSIKHRPGKKHQNSDYFSRWPLENSGNNPAQKPENHESFPILAIHVCELEKEFFNLIKESYSKKCDYITLTTCLTLSLPPLS